MMVAALPSPQTTLVILLGASEWPSSPQLFAPSEAYAKTATRLKRYLLDPEQFGLPQENLLDLFNSPKTWDELDVEIGIFFEQRISMLYEQGNPARDVLVYFIGHGGFAGVSQDYYLAIHRTRHSSLRASGVLMRSLAETITEQAKELRRFLILDCCFAGSAVTTFQGDPSQGAIRQTLDAFQANSKKKTHGIPEKGTTVFCSSGHLLASFLMPDESSTMFSKALLDALCRGDTERQKYLSFRDVRDLAADLLYEISQTLESDHLKPPRPVLESPDQSYGDVAEIPFFPNPAYAHKKNVFNGYYVYDSGKVTFTHLLGREFVPATNNGQVIHILLEAKPADLMAQIHMPLNLALVIDHSNSMRGAKLKNVREAVKMVIDRLEPTDYISVVIFNDTAQVIIPSLPANDKPGMKAAIDRIQNTGGRTMSLGMIQGLGELRRWHTPTTINRMILLTDGVTYGDSNRCRQLARDAAADGISIYPLGIGVDWDEMLLDDIGELSGGSPAESIRSPADAMTIFEEQVQRAGAMVVRNATLTLRLPTGVTPRKAVKVLPISRNIDQSSLSDHLVTISLGDLEKNAAKSVLVELIIEPCPAGVSNIGHAELSYDIPGTDIVSHLRDDIKVTFTNDVNQTMYYNVSVMNFIKKANKEIKTFSTANGITYPSGNICPKCGFLNRPSASYCNHDGQPLEANSPCP